MQAELSLYVNINTTALCEKPCQTSSLDEPSYWGSAVTSKGTMPPPASATTVPLLAGDRTDVHQSRIFGSRNLSQAQMWKNPPGPHVSGIGTCCLGTASAYPPLQKWTERRKDDKKSFRIWKLDQGDLGRKVRNKPKLVCEPCDRHPVSAIPSHIHCCFHRNPNSLSRCCRSVQPAYSTGKPTPCTYFGICLRCFPKQTTVNNTQVLWLVQKPNEILPCGCWPLIPCVSAGWGAPRSDFIQINQNTTNQNMSTDYFQGTGTFLKIYIMQIACQLMCNRL